MHTFKFGFRSESEAEARKGFSEEYAGVPVTRVKQRAGWWTVEGELKVELADLVRLAGLSPAQQEARISSHPGNCLCVECEAYVLGYAHGEEGESATMAQKRKARPAPVSDALPSLEELQATLPWSNSYTTAFRGNRQPHKHFTHALLHVVKAAGHLASLVDDLDHTPGDSGDRTPPSVDGLRALHKRYLADVVISALRAANVFPGGRVDLAREVAARLTRNAETKGT